MAHFAVERFIDTTAQTTIAHDSFHIREWFGHAARSPAVSLTLQAAADEMRHADPRLERLLSEPFVYFIRQEYRDPFHENIIA